MPDTWKQWEGQVVNGKFPLLRYLGGSEHSAVFLTERHEGEHLLKAAIKLIPEDREVGELQLSRWRQATDLSHPNLIPLFEAGRCDIGGVPLLYVVMECAEENLAQVLPDRALTPDEARAMLDSALDVLSYLHGKGFVHGHIKPANIMANGDLLKVTSDGLRRAGESPDGAGRPGAYDPPENAREGTSVAEAMSPAGDVWSLGMTLVETLTQHLPVAGAAEQQDPRLPQALPQLFLDIVRHCLVRRPQGRWTVAQITERLQGRGPVAHATAQAPQARRPARGPQPVARPPWLGAKHLSYAMTAVVGFVLVLAAILAAPRLLRHHSEAPQAPAAAIEQPPVPPAPKQVKKAPEERPTKAPRPSAVEEAQDSAGPAPVPASIHPKAIHEEETNTLAKLPAGALVHGEVAQQVLPEVLKSARDTIRGKVKVSVKVDVDRSGTVEGAELESPGPSRYFARAALQAAQLWKFKPPKIGGQGVLSNWTLRFEFTRNETTVVPKQENP
jgi:TonB family protein